MQYSKCCVWTTYNAVAYAFLSYSYYSDGYASLMSVSLFFIPGILSLCGGCIFRYETFKSYGMTRCRFMYKNHRFGGVCCLSLPIITPKEETSSSSDTSYVRIREYLSAPIWEPPISSPVYCTVYERVRVWQRSLFKKSVLYIGLHLVWIAVNSFTYVAV